jgi:hypothetical protein
MNVEVTGSQKQKTRQGGGFCSEPDVSAARPFAGKQANGRRDD